MEAYLDSDCMSHVAAGRGLCHGCPDAVKQAPSGRWFITIGHPGFNSFANNRSGYISRGAALWGIYRRSK